MTSPPPPEEVPGTNDRQFSLRREFSTRLDRPAAWVLIVGSVLGLVASFELVVSKIALLADPSFSLACDINPVLACGSVIATPQAEVFGFPNPVLGLVGFAVTLTLGVLALARVELPRWVWIGVNVGAGLGFVFVCWLVWQSLYSIGSLCPWCMVVWVCVVPMFVWVSAANLQSGRLRLGAVVRDGVVGLRFVLVGAWYVTVAALIFLRWSDFWLSAL